jgi:hypothetical protein
MSEFSSLAAFAGFLTGMVAEYDHTQNEQMERATKIVQKEAKRVIGTYEYGWPQLASATQANRSQAGYSPNEPGLMTGEMQESIETHVAPRKIIGSTEGEIGSNDDNMVYFELGTYKQPPRSVLMEAAVHKEKEVVEILGEGAVKPLLSGRGTL